MIDERTGREIVSPADCIAGDDDVTHLSKADEAAIERMCASLDRSREHVQAMTEDVRAMGETIREIKSMLPQ